MHCTNINRFYRATSLHKFFGKQLTILVFAIFKTHIHKNIHINRMWSAAERDWKYTEIKFICWTDSTEYTNENESTQRNNLSTQIPTDNQPASQASSRISEWMSDVFE